MFVLVREIYLSDRLILPVLLLAFVSLGLGVFLPVVEVSNLAIFASGFRLPKPHGNCLRTSSTCWVSSSLCSRSFFRSARFWQPPRFGDVFRILVRTRRSGSGGLNSLGAGPVRMCCWWRSPSWLRKHLESPMRVWKSAFGFSPLPSC